MKPAFKPLASLALDMAPIPGVVKNVGHKILGAGEGGSRFTAGRDNRFHDS